MPTWYAGFPNRREVVERYAQHSGADLRDLHWYVQSSTSSATR